MFIATTDRFSDKFYMTNFQRTGLQICNKGPELAYHDSAKNRNIKFTEIVTTAPGDVDLTLVSRGMINYLVLKWFNSC